MERAAAIRLLVDDFEGLRPGHTTRVGVDGPDAAGKTWLADELGKDLRGRGRPSIRASIDGFHRPRSSRHQRGELSPEGYYLDSFDQEALVHQLLAPLGPGGDGWYRRFVFDHRSNERNEDAPKQAELGSVLVFDGVFLHRPELRPYWDYTVFVRVSNDTILKRAKERDAALLGGDREVEVHYRSRYLPAQLSYVQNIGPERLANAVIVNEDLANPSVVLQTT